MKVDLENRLITFAVGIIELTEKLPDTRAGNHLANQLVRSGTSPALNYGEAQSAESRKDFIHKLKIVLKELRESQIGLKMISESKIHPHDDQLKILITESDELISIFYKSIETAKKNAKSPISKSNKYKLKNNQ